MTNNKHPLPPQTKTNNKRADKNQNNFYNKKQTKKHNAKQREIKEIHRKKKGNTKNIKEQL